MPISQKTVLSLMAIISDMAALQTHSAVLLGNRAIHIRRKANRDDVEHIARTLEAKAREAVELARDTTLADEAFNEEVHPFIVHALRHG